MSTSLLETMRSFVSSTSPLCQEFIFRYPTPSLVFLVLIFLYTTASCCRLKYVLWKISRYCRRLVCQFTPAEDGYEYSSLEAGYEVNGDDNQSSRKQRFNVHKSWMFWFLLVLKSSLSIAWIVRYMLHINLLESSSLDIFMIIKVSRILIWVLILVSMFINALYNKRTSEPPYAKVWFLVETFVSLYNLEASSKEAKQDIISNFWLIQMSAAFLLWMISFTWERKVKWPWETDSYDTLDDCSVHATYGEGTLYMDSPSPEAASNWFIRATCAWVVPLLVRAQKKGKLDFKDLPKLPHASTVHENKYKVFVNFWNQEFAKKRRKSSLLKVCWHSFHTEFIYLLVPLIGFLFCFFLNLFMLQWVLEGIEEEKNQKVNTSLMESSFWLVIMYLLVQVGTVVTYTDFMFKTSKFVFQIRYVWIRVIYRKSLCLSQIERLRMNKGKLQNLVSTDCENILNGLAFLLMDCVSVLLRILISCIALSFLVGVAFLPSLLIIIVILALTSPVTNAIRKYTDMMYQAADERLRLTADGIKSSSGFKSLGWDRFVISWIEDVRKQEIYFLRKKLIWSFFENSISIMIPNLVDCVTILVFILLGNQISISLLFMTTKWLRLLRNSLRSVPNILNRLINVLASFARIRELLIANEKTSNNIVSESMNDIVCYHNATLSWYQNYSFESISTNAEAEAVELERGRIESLVTPLTRENELELLRRRDDIIIDVGKANNRTTESCVCRWLNLRNRQKNNSNKASLPRHIFQRQDILCGINGSTLFQSHKLNIIIGQTGSGKSTLISSITGGEVEVRNGRVLTCSSAGVAFVSQVPWLRNDTIRENILFGKAYEETRYNETLRLCELKEDLKRIKLHDMHKLCEKGSNLSGGQRARIGLARAIYRQDVVDLFVFDDTLSSLDASVSSKVFENILSSSTGFLKDSTRVLVTHDYRWVAKADNIIYLKNNKIEFVGSLGELAAKLEITKDDFVDSLLRHINENQSRQKQEDGSKRKVGSETVREKENLDGDKAEKDNIKYQGENVNDQDIEIKKTGSVEKAIYWRLVGFMGYCRTIFTVLLCALQVLFITLQGFWLAYWVEGNGSDSKNDYTQKMYFIVYSMLMFTCSIVNLLLWVLIFLSTYFAVIKLHADLVKSVFSASMAFFWKIHSGRLLNRFGSDINSVQNSLGFSILNALQASVSGLSILVPICILVPYLLPVIFVLFTLMFILNRLYLLSERDLKRISKNSTSPLYLHFGETLEGIDTIHAFRTEDDFTNDCSVLIHDKNRAEYHYKATQLFCSGSMGLIGTLFVFICMVLILTAENSGLIRPAFGALILTYVSDVQNVIHSFIRSITNLEVNMVSVERLVEYIDEDTESAQHSGEQSVSSSRWLPKGRIQFEGVRFKYNEGDEAVLGRNDQGFSLTVEAGEHIVFLGRTGSGKTSIFNMLLRFKDCYEGRVLIDGIDITSIPHIELRDNISCVMQDIVIFSTTLRKNLDPTEKHTDEHLWTILEKVGLKNKIEGKNKKLDLIITSDDAQEFSLGERQLICLARALVKDANILLLDEMTSSIDMVADETVQKVVSDMKGTTVLSISHRLESIYNFDRVVVLSNGGVTAEFDDPQMLSRNKSSTFYNLLS